MISTRLYTPEDYPMVKKWWEARGMEAIPMGLLPNCGVVVYADLDRPALVGWIYYDNSVGVALLAWYIGDPEAKFGEMEECLPHLLGAAETVARGLGYRVMFTLTDRVSLKNRLADAGYIKSCDGVTGYTKVL